MGFRERYLNEAEQSTIQPKYAPTGDVLAKEQQIKQDLNQTPPKAEQQGMEPQPNKEAREPVEKDTSLLSFALGNQPDAIEPADGKPSRWKPSINDLEKDQRIVNRYPTRA